MSIVVIGSSNTDMVVQVPHLPQAGETILGGVFSQVAGGKGANQAVAAAKLGGDVTFLATLGDDTLGDQALNGFKLHNINTQHIERIKNTASGVALISVSQQTGQNSISVASGANAKLSTDYIERHQSIIKNADYIIAQLETPIESITLASQIAKDSNIPFILNPAPAQELPENLLKNVSIITPNETEASLLSGIKVTGIMTAKEAAKSLHRKGINTVIITLGELGSLVSQDGLEQVLAPSFPVKAIDTTAAGDTFNGALCVALSQNKSLLQAVEFANAAGALSVTKAGAQPSVPSLDEVQQMLAKN